MKKLSELYPNYIGEDVLIKDIKINSKEVEQGDIFVCIKGVTADRHDFIDEAIRNGASAIVVDRIVDYNIPTIKVENTNQELPLLASRFYDHPENELEIIAVTGTNGKTTVAQIIKDLIGDTCGYLGTNGIICSKFNEPIRNTTPDSDRLYKYFRKFVSSGCTYLSMETSSEAFYRKRLDNLKFKVGIITNVTEDHLNIHKTLENYVSCKKELVTKVREDGYSILNIDDTYYEEFKNIAKGTILTYGKKNNATLQIIDANYTINNTQVTLKYNNEEYKFTSPLLGEFNVYNLCAAILALISLNFKIEDILNRIPMIKSPSGRVEFLNFNQDYHIILDYAHTPAAFTVLYNLLLPIKKGKIITVTGSAGGREKEKRPSMGKIVLDNSDYVIFTMDDPRYEDVLDIVSDLTSITDKNNYEVIIDRKEAIYKALKIAKKDDIVLIAGKGIDNYMAIQDKYLPYSDLDVIKDYFKN